LTDKLTRYKFDTNQLFIQTHKDIIEVEILGNPQNYIQNFLLLKDAHEKNARNDNLSNIIPEFFQLKIINKYPELDHKKAFCKTFEESFLKLTTKPSISNKLGNISKHKQSLKVDPKFILTKLRFLSIIDKIRSFPVSDFLKDKNDNITNIQVKVQDNYDTFIPKSRYIFPSDSCFINFDDYSANLCK
jgi:hypothetical protein